MGLKNLFWNSQQRRLRAFWRLVIQALLFLIIAVTLGAMAGLALAAWGVFRGGSEFAGQSLFRALNVAVVLVAVVASIWLAGRFLDRRRFADFGFHFDRAWWLDLGFGLGLGAVLMAGIFLAERGLGWVTVTATFQSEAPGQPFGLSILLSLAGFLAVGLYEELWARGYQLRNLAEGLNWPAVGSQGGLLLAWLLSSALFGLLHAGNPNASAASTGYLVVAGLFLGLGFILTGELAIPIGLHIAWNFFQGNVFGFPVSGTDAGARFIAVAQGGPDLWTGGAFGPEGGLVGLVAILVGSLLILAWVRFHHGPIALRLSLAIKPDSE